MDVEKTNQLKALKLAAYSAGVLVGEYDLGKNQYTVYSESIGQYNEGTVIENALETFSNADYIYKDSKKVYSEVVRQIKRGLPYVQKELHIITESGSDKWYNTSFTAVFDDDNKPCRVIVCGIDITESKKLEKTYNEEIEYQQASPEDGYLPKVRVNISQDIIENYNAGKIAAISHSGAKYSEAVQKFVKNAVTREQRKELKHLCKRESIIERFHNGETQWSTEYQRRLNDKSIQWVKVNIKAKTNPETGDIICFIYIHNIDERKNKEIALQTLAAINYDFVGIVDCKNGQFQAVARSDVRALPSESYANYNEITKQSADAYKESFLTYEDYIKAREWVSFENVTEHLSNEDVYEFYVKIKAPDEEHIATYNIIFFYIDDDKTKFLVSRSNVTDAIKVEQKNQLELEKALEEVQLVSEAKSNFMVRINRDIRTPLNAIFGYTELCDDIDNVEELKFNIDRIKDSSDFLLRVIDEMVDEHENQDDDINNDLNRQDSMNAIISKLKGKRILLCEDHPLNAEIAHKLLEKVGCIIDNAWNGKEAVEKFDRSKEYYYDAILMDILMPALDGISATKYIRSRERDDALLVPIIAMTAGVYEKDIKVCFEAGMNSHLAKPIDRMRLYKTLAKEIGKSHYNDN